MILPLAPFTNTILTNTYYINSLTDRALAVKLEGAAIIMIQIKVLYSNNSLQNVWSFIVALTIFT